MVAVRKSLAVDAGTTFDLSIHYLDSNRVPVDVSGNEANLKLFVPGKENQAAYGTFPAVQMTNDGWIVFKLTDEQTAVLPKGKSAFRVELVVGSDVYGLMYGPLLVRSLTDV